MSDATISDKGLGGLKAYFEKPILATFLLGMASGFPLTLVISITGLWLSKYGVDKKTVGIFALATTPYAWKFLWSPVIDRTPLGWFGRVLGHRRSWLFLIQGLMAAAILVVATLDPTTQIGTIGILIVTIGFLSASQDIVIDAYRIEIVEKEQLGHGATMIAFGYRAANLIAGYGVLVAANYIGWGPAIALLALMVLPGTIAALWVGEPTADTGSYLRKEEAAHQGMGRAGLWFYEAVVLPFKEFMTRDNWLLILLFIFLFKAGDAVAAIMTAPLIVELQFTELEIANANKLVGTIALWLGIALGSLLYFWAGTFRSLFITGILMMVTNLVFAWLATQGHDVIALAITIGAENFATGLGNTVVIAYLSSLCNLSFTATQYALLSSLASQGRAILGAPSGFLADAMGWVDFFIVSTLLAVPGLLVLMILWKKDVNANALEKVNGARDL